MKRTTQKSTLAKRLNDYIGRSHTSLRNISKKANIPEFTLMRFTIGSGLLNETYANNLIETLDELEKDLNMSGISMAKC